MFVNFYIIKRLWYMVIVIKLRNFFFFSIYWFIILLYIFHVVWTWVIWLVEIWWRCRLVMQVLLLHVEACLRFNEKKFPKMDDHLFVDPSALHVPCMFLDFIWTNENLSNISTRFKQLVVHYFWLFIWNNVERYLRFGFMWFI